MDSEDFEPIEDYIVNSAYGTNDITANYSPPRLEPGKYEIKVQAYDFNGNLGMRTVKSR